VSKRLIIWGAGLIGLLLLLGVAAWILLPPRTGTVVIEVSGAAATKFRGSCELDGNRRDLSGVAPATPFTLEGHKLVYSITPAEGSRGVSVKVDVGGRASGSVSSGDSPQGVHGWVQFGRFSPSYWIESFDPKNPERWMKPPP
jgi:hypothetical protein